MQLNIRKNGHVVSIPAYPDAVNPHEHNIYLRQDGKKFYIPLMQDATDSPIHCRFDDGVYGIDPCADPTNYLNSQKLMHLTNSGGQLKDLIGNTTWTVSGCDIPSGDGENRIEFHNAENDYGHLDIENSGPINPDDSDFTILIDYLILGKNELTVEATPPSADVIHGICLNGTGSGCGDWRAVDIKGNTPIVQEEIETGGNDDVEQKNKHVLYSGGKGGLLIELSNDLMKIDFGCNTENPSDGMVTADMPKTSAFNKESRLVIWKHDGKYSAWANGIQIVKDCTKSGDFSYAGKASIGYAGYGPLNGWIRNFVIWDSTAFVDTPPSADVIQGICLNGTGSGSGDWRAVDIDGNTPIVQEEIETGGTVYGICLNGTESGHGDWRAVNLEGNTLTEVDVVETGGELYGICLNGAGTNGSGDWKRIDIDGNAQKIREKS